MIQQRESTISQYLAAVCVKQVYHVVLEIAHCRLKCLDLISVLLVLEFLSYLSPRMHWENTFPINSQYLEMFEFLNLNFQIFEWPQNRREELYRSGNYPDFQLNLKERDFEGQPRKSRLELSFPSSPQCPKCLTACLYMQSERETTFPSSVTLGTPSHAVLLFSFTLSTVGCLPTSSQVSFIIPLGDREYRIEQREL